MTVDWPLGLDRTPHGRRDPNKNFSVSLARAVELLEEELGRLDPDNWRAAFGNQHTKSNGLPLYNANPDDPGFVLRWTMDGEDFAVACDAHTRLRDNIRQVGLWVRETRKRGERPVETGESEFAAARLPSGEAVVCEPPAHAVLGLNPGRPRGEVEEAFRERIKEAHPDNGGSAEEFARVQDARDELLEGSQ